MTGVPDTATDTASGTAATRDVHELTLGDVLREHRRSRPGGVAVVCGDERWTYPQLDDRVNRLAGALRDDGVQGGERILWLGQNCHRLLEALLAAAKLGAVICPVNWRQSAEEMVFVIEDTAPRAVLWQRQEIGDTVDAARTEAKSDAVWIQHDGSGPDGYEAYLSAGRPDDGHWAVDPRSSLLQLYTGAFGGRPHGAQLSHWAILSQALMISMVQQIDERTVYLNSGPMFHMATLMTTFATLHMGGTNVMTRRVDAAELCRIIEHERCNYGFVMGPTAQEIMELNRDGRYDLSSFRTFGGNAAWNAMISPDTSPWGRHPAGYGQTEVTGMLTFNALAVGVVGTSGRVSPWAQVRVVDPDGMEVPTGETGEIVARGPIVTNGYHDRADLNASRMRGGWWHSGDLGRREEDGSITFVAPLTRIVKSAAENIYPAEVEACLQTHPAVAAAAIIGVPDPTWTQRVLAVVQLQPGAQPSADELIEHCRSHIASYKKPSVVEFVDDLPRKGFAVDYDALDERFGGGGYPGLG
jgi:acyl-CoA synthetase (AMP-forming)/AMP-acid ligase II